MTKRTILILASLTIVALACLPSGVQPPATLPPTVAITATPAQSTTAQPTLDTPQPTVAAQGPARQPDARFHPVQHRRRTQNSYG